MGIFFLHNREPGVETLLEKLYIPHGSRLDKNSPPRAVVRWGSTIKEPERMLTLNRLAPVLRAMRTADREEALRRHGLKPGRLNEIDGQERPAMYTALYWIPVFHMEALAIYEKSLVEPLLYSAKLESGRGYREVGRKRNGFHVLRAMKTAVRSVYALGLDFALVQIGIHPIRGTLVLDVKPEPKLTAKMADLFASAINRFSEEQSAVEGKEQSVMLGADPEFILRSRLGKIIPASRYMERTGEVGCDAVVLRGRRLIHPLVELRPEPAADPLALVENIRTGMRQAVQMIPDDSLDWLSGGMPVKGIPLGGHIHFSGVWLYAGLIRQLDNYLALPFVLLEDEASRQRRPLYGYLGDFRRKPHGGFEYRSLPSWLASPKIAAGVLCLARLIADHCRELRQEPLANVSMQQAFYRGSRKELLPAVNKLWEEIEGLSTYKTYYKELSVFKEMLFSGCVPAISGDFRSAWNLG